MGITSLSFIAFCAISIIAYYSLAPRFRWIVLLILSITYFILSGNVLLLIYPLLSVFASWICTNQMDRIRDSQNDTAKQAVYCKYYLWGALIVNLGILIVLKYLNLGVYTCNAFNKYIIRSNVSVEAIHLLAPLGLSFYTLSLLSYIFDVYYGLSRSESNFFKLLLFCTYFPIIVSGPIIRYKDTGKELITSHSFDYNNLTHGLQRMVWGFFKVLVISERLAILTGPIFSDYSDYSGFYIILGAVCFTFQLYTNFSGSMDIVIGLSTTFGIILPENFRQPFFSETIQEFWQRWHITLGGWLRDYILYPILRTKPFAELSAKCKERYGKKKAKHITTYLAMMILWIIAGLWHGGAWKYIWGVGVLQGIYIIIGEIVKEKNTRKAAKDSKLGMHVARFLRRMRTFLLITIALLFFNANSLTAGFVMLGSIFRTWNPYIFTDGSLFELGLDRINMLILIVSLLVLLTVSMLQQKKSICDRLAELNIVLRWAILYALIFSVILFGNYGPGYSAAEFIYQGF